MTPFELLALLLGLSAVLGFANERWLKLGTAIGATIGGLLASLLLLALTRFGVIGDIATDTLRSIDFSRILMQGMLSFLLFAGAFEVDVEQLIRHRRSILTLATLGVLISTAIVGTGMWLAGRLLGVDISFGYALLFGALISPTDPIAVIGILRRRTNAPPEVVAMISGESLFNDGVGVVVFTIVLGLVAGGAEPTAAHLGRLFLEEAVGGVAFGALLGFVANELLRRIDNYRVEILITLAVVTGGYALAGRLHTSGPLAMVLAGLLIGSRGREFAMSEQTEERLEGFWEVVDDILNAILFVLIGIELLVLELRPAYFLLGALAIPIVLLARFVSVGLPLTLFRLFQSFRRYTVRVMTWGGLRGGIAIALALSIPAAEDHDLIVVATYVVVVFSILVQGLTIEPLMRRAYGGVEPGTTPPELRGISDARVHARFASAFASTTILTFTTRFRRI